VCGRCWSGQKWPCGRLKGKEVLVRKKWPENKGNNVELLKIILDFISKIANPLVVCLLFILFRKEVGSIFEVLRGILEEVREHRLAVSVGNVKVGDLAKNTAKQLQETNLDSAAQIVQELLSPAAPLAVGYVENFVVKMKRGEGGVQFNVTDASTPATSIYTIYIPHELTDEDTSSIDLIHAKYPGANIEKISIESNAPGGRKFNGSAIRHEDSLLPVDVPQTLTSIRLVFKFREEQLKVKGHLESEQIKKLEADSLDQFAKILQDRITELEMRKCVRVIRDPAHLFARTSKPS
jgi:hypothetical protein